MNRRRFIGAVAALGLPLVLIGCGGGGDDNSNRSPVIDNPSGSDTVDLSNMTVQPFFSQSAFISRGTAFAISWPSLASAPRTVQVDLIRYLEARGGDSREDVPTNVTIRQSGTSPLWAIAEQGDMDAGGVYYLDIRTELDERRFAYVVDFGRAARVPGTRAVTITNRGGTSPDLSKLTLRWTGDSTGSVNLSNATVFVLQFPTSADAPPNFTVRLFRYKEARGSDSFSDDEQDIQFTNTPGTASWVIQRQDQARLESGTYVLEISVPGMAIPLDYAFIIQ